MQVPFPRWESSKHDGQRRYTPARLPYHPPKPCSPWYGLDYSILKRGVRSPCPGQLEMDKIKHKQIFPADDHHLPQLVNHWAYSDEIASYFGAKPNLMRWFFRNPFKYTSLPSHHGGWFL